MASSKFNAKNLHYEKPAEPAFLRKLRGQTASADGRTDVQHARPGKKSRLDMDGDDDGPTIAYEREGGGNVGRDEYEALTKSKLVVVEEEEGEKSEAKEKVGDESVETVEREKQRVADVGGLKKRKVGKVVAGDYDDGGDDGGGAGIEGAKTRVGAGAHLVSAEAAKPEVKSKSKPVKKQKKVKLSFDEPDS